MLWVIIVLRINMCFQYYEGKVAVVTTICRMFFTRIGMFYKQQGVSVKDDVNQRFLDKTCDMTLNTGNIYHPGSNLFQECSQYRGNR